MGRAGGRSDHGERALGFINNNNNNNNNNNDNDNDNDNNNNNDNNGLWASFPVPCRVVIMLKQGNVCAETVDGRPFMGRAAK